MNRLKLAIFFFTLSLVLLGCSGDSSQSADDGAAATIDAQNTRIAELSAPTSESIPFDATSTEVPVIPTATASPTSIPEQDAGIVWKLEGLSGVYPVPEIGLAYAYWEAADMVQAINLDDGKVIWTIEGKGRLLGADKDYVYTLPFEQRIDAFDVETGEFQWFSTIPDKLGGFASQTGLLEVQSNANFLLVRGRYEYFAVDKNTGEAFVIQGSEAEVFDKVIVVDNGRGYLEPQAPLWDIGNRNRLPKCGGIVFDNVPDGNGAVIAFDANTGTELWTAKYPGYARQAFCPGSDKVDLSMNNIYLLALDFPVSNLVAIDGQTGEIKFVNQETTAARINTMPFFYEDASVVWSGGAVGINVFTQPEFGVTEARSEIDNLKIWENPSYSLFTVLGGFENILVGVQINESLTGIDKDSGEILWELATKDFYHLRLINDQVVYITLSAEFINIVDVRSGDTELIVPLRLSDSIPRITQYEENHLVVWNYGVIAVLRLP
jgi:outer membrane protein assembly factor BamB